MKYPQKAIYKSKTKNLLQFSLQDGEEVVFIDTCSKPSHAVEGYAFYARPHEKWSLHLVNIKNLKEIKYDKRNNQTNS
jgi:hypothetical protein